MAVKATEAKKADNAADKADDAAKKDNKNKASAADKAGFDKALKSAAEKPNAKKAEGGKAATGAKGDEQADKANGADKAKAADKPRQAVDSGRQRQSARADQDASAAGASGRGGEQAQGSQRNPASTVDGQDASGVARVRAAEARGDSTAGKPTQENSAQPRGEGRRTQQQEINTKAGENFVDYAKDQPEGSAGREWVGLQEAEYAGKNDDNPAGKQVDLDKVNKRQEEIRNDPEKWDNVQKLWEQSHDGAIEEVTGKPAGDGNNEQQWSQPFADEATLGGGASSPVGKAVEKNDAQLYSGDDTSDAWAEHSQLATFDGGIGSGDTSYLTAQGQQRLGSLNEEHNAALADAARGAGRNFVEWAGDQPEGGVPNRYGRLLEAKWAAQSDLPESDAINEAPVDEQLESIRNDSDQWSQVRNLRQQSFTQAFQDATGVDTPGVADAAFDAFENDVFGGGTTLQGEDAGAPLQSHSVDGTVADIAGLPPGSLNEGLTALATEHSRRNYANWAKPDGSERRTAVLEQKESEYRTLDHIYQSDPELLTEEGRQRHSQLKRIAPGAHWNHRPPPAPPNWGVQGIDTAWSDQPTQAMDSEAEDIDLTPIS